jgi:hypothetical protein
VQFCIPSMACRSPFWMITASERIIGWQGINLRVNFDEIVTEGRTFKKRRRKSWATPCVTGLIFCGSSFQPRQSRQDAAHTRKRLKLL